MIIMLTLCYENVMSFIRGEGDRGRSRGGECVVERCGEPRVKVNPMRVSFINELINSLNACRR